MSGTEGLNSLEQPSEGKGAKADGPVAITSSVGGVSVLLNLLLTYVCNVPQEQLTDYLTLTPLLSAFFCGIVAFLWKAWGHDPVRIRNERSIKRAMKRSKKQLKDPHLSENDKIEIRQQYSMLSQLYRSSGMEEDSSNLR